MKDKVRASELFSRQYVILTVVLAIVHVLAAQLGLLLSHPELHVTLVWPPSGIALAAVLLLGYRAWPGIFIGDVVVALLEGHPPLMWLGGPLGNTLAAVVGAWALYRWARFDVRLRRARDIISLALVGGLLGTLIGATFGAGTLTVSGRIPADSFWMAWLMWWLGDTVGVTVIAPSLLIFGALYREGWRPTWRRETFFNVVVPFAVLVISNLVVFSSGLLRGHQFSVAFAAFPALIWIAMRLGIAGAGPAVLVTASIAVVGTLAGLGPFSGPNGQENLAVLWSFIAVVAFTVLPLGASVTERIRTARALRASQQTLQRVIDNMPVLFDAFDERGVALFWNKECERVTGYSAQEVVGNPDMMALLCPDPAYRAWVLEQLQELGNAYRDWELEIRRKDGETRTIAWSNVSRHHPIPGWWSWGTGVDVTRRVQAQRALRTSQKKLANAQRLAHVGNWDWNVQTGQVEWSDEVYNIFGLDAQEFDPQIDAVMARFHPDDQHLYQELTAQAVASREQFTFETRILLPDGRVRFLVSTSEGQYDEGGNLVRILGTVQDITARKQAETELKAYSERLEEMVQARTRELEAAQEQLLRREKLAVLGQLAGGVGHELRNPLGAINNAAYLLNLILKDPEPQVKEALQIMVKEVKTSERIINSLLDFARARPPLRRSVDVNDVLQASLACVAVPDSVQVVCRLDEELPVILADPDQLEQVFGNLICNAVQAMPSGGRLKIGTGVAGEGQVRLTFVDTGTGIPEENLGKIFEPLFTTKAKGIGLGLALVKTLVEGHGGTVKVESEEGEGSTFAILLPRLQDAPS